MRKKLLSSILAGALAVSVVAGSAISASATQNADGTYTKTDAATVTHRYYLAMPDVWFNEESAKAGDTAGIYWYNGTDVCKSMAGTGDGPAWPGYKCYTAADYANDAGKANVFYADIPKDVPNLCWNNGVNGGTDTSLPIYSLARQTDNNPTEWYADGDSDAYDLLDGFWDFVAENSEAGSFEVFGDYASNFKECYDDNGDAGFTFDNMIFIIDPTSSNTNVDGKTVDVGEWYFIIAPGYYSNWPTQELAEAHRDDDKTVIGKFSKVTDPSKQVDIEEKEASPDEARGNSDSNTPGQPSTNPTSATKPAATSSSAANNANGSVATGEFSIFAVVFVVVAGALGVFYFTRKRYNK